jgi:uncharacterized OB-fold protein
MKQQSRLPVPDVLEDDEAAPYWQAAREGRLMLPRCDRCATVIWYPRQFCPACGSSVVSWFEASGTGRVYSYSMIRRGQAEYSAAVPYLLAYVELEEGPRVLTNLVDFDTEPAIGQRVSALFEHDSAGAGLLRFRPAES